MSACWSVGHRVLICDRDRKWSWPARRVLDDAVLGVVQTPFQTLNANAHAERFVRSIRDKAQGPLVRFAMAKGRFGPRDESLVRCPPLSIRRPNRGTETAKRLRSAIVETCHIGRIDRFGISQPCNRFHPEAAGGEIAAVGRTGACPP